MLSNSPVPFFPHTPPHPRAFSGNAGQFLFITILRSSTLHKLGLLHPSVVSDLSPPYGRVAHPEGRHQEDREQLQHGHQPAAPAPAQANTKYS